MQPGEFALTIHKRLLDTYGVPEWRNPVSPLDELVSTILSQNTNDTNRDRAFKSLKARFPTWKAVRDADEHEVIGAIRTAGLANQKGPRIQNLLREITAQRGELDLDFLKKLSTEEASDWLRSFKGVGPKTAAIAILLCSPSQYNPSGSRGLPRSPPRLRILSFKRSV
jgi:endonuclease-3